MKWAIRIRWMDANGKWHRKTTKWYSDYEDAWGEADKFNPEDCLEMSRSLIHTR